MRVIRVRHPKGILKIEVVQGASALWLYEQVARQLAPLYTQDSSIKSFYLADDPENPESSRVDPEANNLKLDQCPQGHLLYLHLKRDLEAAKPVEAPILDVDDTLARSKGLVRRTRDERVCRHGPTGMCDRCQPLEPYDEKYLEEHGIKHLSFYSWLKKLEDSNNRSIPLHSLLEPVKYTVDLNCSNHAPFPAGICSKCQPSAIILRRQAFRMVDHVEIAAPRLVDDFLAGWRSSGFQRFGWLLGHYEDYSDQVPLGIKAVVEHIYEPAQDGSIDGFQLLGNDEEIDPRDHDILRRLGLQVVGMVYTDLIDDGSATGRVKHRRSKETFFLSSPEVFFIARQQSRHPCVFRKPFRPAATSATADFPMTFSSRFVTLIVSGEADGGIGIQAYQVSESAAGMVEAELISATTDPSMVLVSQENQTEKYIPQVFYKYKNEYGFDVQKAADPFFPVEYLIVTLSEGIPLHPQPLLSSPLIFPPPHLHPNRRNLTEYFSAAIGALDDSTIVAASGLLCNANLLIFLNREGLIKGEQERAALCQALSSASTAASAAALQNFLETSESWQQIMAAIAQGVAESHDAAQGSENESWSCVHCTFVNRRPTGGECEMCGLPQQ